MAKERNVSFEIADVRQVILRCAYCPYEVSFVPKTTQSIPRTCPECGMEWYRPGGIRSSLHQHTTSVLEAFKYFRALGGKNSEADGPTSWSVRLVIEGDD